MAVRTTAVFQTLERQHPELLRLVREKQHVLCVPLDAALQTSGVKLDEDFLKTHILQRPHLSADLLVTLNGKTLQRVHGELRTRSGFAQDRSMLFLAETALYDDNMEKLVLWTFDKPFEGAYRSVSQDAVPTSVSITHSVEAAAALLPDSIVASIRRDIESMEHSYVIVKGFVSDAADRLQTMVDSLPPAEQFRAFELIHHLSYPFIMKSLRACYSTDDAVFHEACLRLQSQSPSDIGVADTVHVGFRADVLALDTVSGPLAALYRLTAAAEEMQSGVRSSEAITSDDLIPLMAYALIQEAPLHAASWVQYLTHFQPSFSTPTDLPLSRLQFYCATYHAAFSVVHQLGRSTARPSPPPRLSHRASTQSRLSRTLSHRRSSGQRPSTLLRSSTVSPQTMRSSSSPQIESEETLDALLATLREKR